MVTESLLLHRIKQEIDGVSFTRVSSKVSWSIVDQAAFSGAGFFMNMFLIWKLSGNGYGQFAVAFTVFLVLAGAHESLVLEPVSVLGSSVSQESLGGYMSNLLILHTGLCLSITVVSVAVFALLPLGELKQVLTPMALVLPLILLAWTSRRLCYITSQARVAAVGSLVYLVTVVAALVVATLLGWLTPALGFVIMGLASIPATGVILARLPVGPSRLPVRAIPREVLKVFKDHWVVGKWVALQQVFSTAISQLGIVMTGLTVGVAAAGVLRALTFTVMPLLQITAAISAMLALPVMAREYGLGNLKRVRQLASRLTVGLMGVSLAYLVFLTALQQPIAHFISGAGEVPSTWLVALKGVSPVVAALGVGAAIGLRATQRVAYYPLSTAIPGVVALISTPLLVMYWGLTGAIVSGLITSVVSTMLSIGLYKRWV